ncbi:hypothetical protein DRN86_00885 [Candidatus Geothermarchaeota archaeon]|nr:MAG: hypothetical protein DRN86_00885 [Candidatus Geothermarchaeota archaeon]
MGGRHKTIIGGKRGIRIVSGILAHNMVKRVILGRIESKGKRTGHGMRFKITKVDEKGNIKIILSHGCSNQEIFVITKASNRIDGEKIAEEILRMVRAL